MNDCKTCYTYCGSDISIDRYLTCKRCGEMFEPDEYISGFKHGRVKAIGDENSKRGKNGFSVVSRD